MSPHNTITDAHVRAVLKAQKGDQAELSSWTTEDFVQKGSNYISFVTSVNIEYAVDGKSDSTSCIVKINPNIGPDDFKAFPIALFQKEVGFYKDILPELNAALAAVGIEALRIPKWYHSSLERSQELVFMEDLRSRGFKMFDRTVGMDEPHALLVVNELARLHAASVLLQAGHPNDDLADKYPCLKLDWHNYPGMIEDHIEKIFAPFMRDSAEIFHKIGGYDGAEKWLNEAVTASGDIFRRHIVRENPFDVLCHGDCWNNNMLFRYNADGEPVEVMMVDFQLNRMASPATDLTYLMFTSLTGDVRGANISNFLMSYHSNFSDILKAAGRPMAFTRDQLLQEYKRRHEFGLLFAVMVVMLVVRPPMTVIDMTEEMSKEEIVKIQEKFRKDNLELMESTPLFKPRFLAIFDDMKENGVFD